MGEIRDWDKKLKMKEITITETRKKSETKRRIAIYNL